MSKCTKKKITAEFSLDQKRKIGSLRKKGKSIKYIAKALHVCDKRVSAFLRGDSKPVGEDTVEGVTFSFDIPKDLVDDFTLHIKIVSLFLKELVDKMR